MDKHEHVYCLDCKHFKFINEEEFIAECPNQEKCYLHEFEDSRAFEERPFYEKK